VHYGVEEITVNVTKMFKKNLLDLFADLAVFESGTLQVNYFEICICIVYFLIKEPRPVDLLNLGNLMISIGYTSQRL
jgi:hypothetical protein